MRADDTVKRNIKGLKVSVHLVFLFFLIAQIVYYSVKSKFLSYIKDKWEKK